GGREWFAWLLPRLADEPRLDVLPCLRAAPALGVVRETPVSPHEAYAEFVDALLGAYGDAFDYVELWGEPNDVAEWDFARDPARRALPEAIEGAARTAKQLGKKVVLGGASPVDPGRLDLLFRHGVGALVDVVGLQGFPRALEPSRTSWDEQLGRVREVLRAHASA